MIAYACFLVGTAIGWVIGFAHRLDVNERQVLELGPHLPTARQLKQWRKERR